MGMGGILVTGVEDVYRLPALDCWDFSAKLEI
jgi:hypothetical protein